jgi:hypothetical protein
MGLIAAAIFGMVVVMPFVGICLSVVCSILF